MTSLYLVDMAMMTPKWQATSRVQRVTDAQTGEYAHETVVTVTDGLGGTWDVLVADSDDRIVALTVRSHDVKQADLRSVPLVEVRSVALAHVREVEKLRDHGYRLADAISEAGEGDLMPGGRVTVAAFAEAWRDAAPTVSEDGRRSPPRRQQLADRFGVSPYTIDKWLRFARDHGALDDTAQRQRRRTDQQREGK